MPEKGEWVWLARYLECRACGFTYITDHDPPDYTWLARHVPGQVQPGNTCGWNHIWPIRRQLTWGGDVRR